MFLNKDRNENYSNHELDMMRLKKEEEKKRKEAKSGVITAF